MVTPDVTDAHFPTWSHGMKKLFDHLDWPAKAGDVTSRPTILMK